jgi:hypothetical protein
MKAFHRFAELAAHLVQQEARLSLAMPHGLKKAAIAVETTAREAFGVYQPSVGSFRAWAPLAESTREDRIRQGYPADEPLLRSGALRDSIRHEVSGLEAVVGSESDVMSYQELGTHCIPPRAVLGSAAVRNQHAIQQLMGQAVVSGIAGVASYSAYDVEI